MRSSRVPLTSEPAPIRPLPLPIIAAKREINGSLCLQAANGRPAVWGTPLTAIVMPSPSMENRGFLPHELLKQRPASPAQGLSHSNNLEGAIYKNPQTVELLPLQLLLSATPCSRCSNLGRFWAFLGRPGSRINGSSFGGREPRCVVANASCLWIRF